MCPKRRWSSASPRWRRTRNTGTASRLNRVHVPELDHSYYIRVPLPDGDIDYRFAISAMVEAGYDGYLAIEGANTGDQLYKDRRSVNYVRGILAELEA